MKINIEKLTNLTVKILAVVLVGISMTAVNAIYVNSVNKNFNIEEYDKEIREYIVNKRSRKIHIENCPSVKKNER